MNPQSILLSAVVVLACSGCAGLWAGAGATGAAAGYEARSKYQLDKLNRDFEAGKMSQEEYEARKAQVKEGSLIY